MLFGNFRLVTSSLPRPVDVTRGCYKEDGDEDREVGCRTAGDTTSCYCDSDKCNGASAVEGATWRVLAALAVLLPTALGARMVM